MCLIIHGKVGNLLKTDLNKAQRNNRDGFGIHLENNNVLYFTSKDQPTAKSVLSQLDASLKATIHFRLATHGNLSKSNLHPFQIGRRIYFMHNGMLFDDEYYSECGLSDTALIAAKIANKPRKYVFKVLNKEVRESGSRFCILRENKFITFGNWSFDEFTQTWHSNSQIIRNTFVY